MSADESGATSQLDDAAALQQRQASQYYAGTCSAEHGLENLMQYVKSASGYGIPFTVSLQASVRRVMNHLNSRQSWHW